MTHGSNKGNGLEQLRRWRKRYPEQRAALRRKQENREKDAAHRRLYRAVKAGKITKPLECSVCNQAHDHIHGHHDDYSKPLEVRWLCPRCHREAHAEQLPNRTVLEPRRAPGTRSDKLA